MRRPSLIAAFALAVAASVVATPASAWGSLPRASTAAALATQSRGLPGHRGGPLLSWWGRRYADGAVVEECYRYHQCFASSLRGTSLYGITCTGLAGRTPCGWDAFTTDTTRSQPNGQ